MRGVHVLPSAMTLTNIGWREYALTMDAIKNDLLFQNKVSLDFEQ